MPANTKECSVSAKAGAGTLRPDDGCRDGLRLDGEHGRALSRSSKAGDASSNAGTLRHVELGSLSSSNSGALPSRACERFVPSNRGAERSRLRPDEVRLCWTRRRTRRAEDNGLRGRPPTLSTMRLPLPLSLTRPTFLRERQRARRFMSVQARASFRDRRRAPALETLEAAPPFADIKACPPPISRLPSRTSTYVSLCARRHAPHLKTVEALPPSGAWRRRLLSRPSMCGPL
ncbi:hypothetical protein BD626DRAFT_122458 [Schizophyllum amplum]|uniref:Uncharacterized protein n=1 Tax=Schizophyllum amplum TaxID=97359 RepID=A0A550C7N2_9AGAR|nr:hypothetical protein BD626DRAFT_122458 [Auriculariopsis ampla]